jgi:hypothetical protein
MHRARSILALGSLHLFAERRWSPALSCLFVRDIVKHRYKDTKDGHSLLEGMSVSGLNREIVFSDSDFNHAV